MVVPQLMWLPNLHTLSIPDHHVRANFISGLMATGSITVKHMSMYNVMAIGKGRCMDVLMFPVIGKPHLEENIGQKVIGIEKFVRKTITNDTNTQNL